RLTTRTNDRVIYGRVQDTLPLPEATGRARRHNVCQDTLLASLLPRCGELGDLAGRDDVPVRDLCRCKDRPVPSLVVREEPRVSHGRVPHRRRLIRRARPVVEPETNRILGPAIERRTHGTRGRSSEERGEG